MLLSKRRLLEIGRDFIQNDVSHRVLIQIAPQISQEIVPGSHQIHHDRVVQRVLVVWLLSGSGGIEHFDDFRSVLLQSLLVLFTVLVGQVDFGDVDLELFEDGLELG